MYSLHSMAYISYLLGEAPALYARRQPCLLHCLKGGACLAAPAHALREGAPALAASHLSYAEERLHLPPLAPQKVLWSRSLVDGIALSQTCRRPSLLCINLSTCSSSQSQC